MKCHLIVWYSLVQAFAKAFSTTPDDLDMHIVYDVSHNIAKVEEHISFCTSYYALSAVHYSVL